MRDHGAAELHLDFMFMGDDEGEDRTSAGGQDVGGAGGEGEEQRYGDVDCGTGAAGNGSEGASWR